METTIERAWRRLEEGREGVRTRVEGTAPERRVIRPTPTTWSMVDVVEHLVLVEDGIRTALAKDPTPDRPREVRWGRWWRFPTMRLVLKTGIRISAPTPAILPAGERSYESLLVDWERSRALLRTWLEGFDRRILGDPRFRHPLVGWLTIPQGITFAADHLEHHLPQLDRLIQG